MQKMGAYDLAGGTIVSGSYQGFDQTYLVNALKKLGSGFVGVTQLPASVTDEEIIQLRQQNIRGLRFNLKRGNTENAKHLRNLAAKVHEIAEWHIELYVDSSMLMELYPILVSMPKVSIDHLGLQKAGLKYLLKLAERGIYVKASGFGRVDFDIQKALKNIHGINPSVLMFGTDLPSTRAPRPFGHDDYLLIIDALGETDARRVFYDNAIKFYNISEKSD